MFSRLRLSQKALILVAVPIAFELLLLGTLGYLLQQAELEADREAHSRAIIEQANQIFKLFGDAGATLFNYAMSRNKKMGERYDRLLAEIPRTMNNLKKLAKDEPEHLAPIYRLEPNLERGMQILDQARGAIDSGSRFDTFMQLRSLKKEIESISGKLLIDIDETVAYERKRQNKTVASAHLRDMARKVVLAGLVLNILAAIALALLVTRGMTRRLEIVVDNTASMKRGEPLSPRQEGGDEIARLDAAFHDMAEALNEVERLKQEFLAMVSHDLKTPLMSVLSSLNLLSAGSGGKLSEEAHDLVQAAEDELCRLTQLINDLLDVARMEAGRFKLNPRNCSLSGVLERSASAVRGPAGQKRISLVLPETDLSIHADEDRLIQVLVNLLSNAIKYSPKRSTITVSLTQGLDDIELSVSDQGAGIPPEYRQIIFERFKQGPGRPDNAGAGLGLAICKFIMEEHGGTIGVKSQPETGSTFWIKLPVASAM